MEAVYPSCTMACSKMFHASLTDYDRALEDVKDQYYKPYSLAAGNTAGCLYLTLPSLPPLPSYMNPPRPTSYQSHSVTLACVDRDLHQSQFGLTY